MTKTEPQQHKLKKQLLAGTLGLSFVLMAIKFYTYFITGSNAVLTDALESIINFVAGGFALYSVILASKPKDLDHPYGHGKIEFLSSGLEGTLISLAGLSSLTLLVIVKYVQDILGVVACVHHSFAALAVTAEKESSLKVVSKAVQEDVEPGENDQEHIPHEYKQSTP